jgi:putative ABC transport system ATP-binding protein
MKTILSIRAVGKKFNQGSESIVALDNISFDIEKPQIVALAGPSGSGKSTLLNLLARFDRVDSGQILIDGSDIDQLQDNELDVFRNRQLGFVVQQFNLIKVLSATENVELTLLPQGLSKATRRQRAEEMLSAVGLADRLNHRPDQMSGGQQQRVAIARALVGKPTLVIADEPTGNLDGMTAHEILQLIHRLNQDFQTTFVIATHDHRVMDMAHRVMTLSDGKSVL